MVEEHGVACARRIVEQGRADGCEPGVIARGIHQHCGVSLLRAHRLAHGWTLTHVATCLRGLIQSGGEEEGREHSGERLSHQRVSQWERGGDIPSPRYMDALCRLYQSRPDLLGFGRDYTAPALVSSRGPARTPERAPSEVVPPLSDDGSENELESEPEDERDEMKRRDVLRTLGSSGIGIVSPSMMRILTAVRKSTDGLLETQSVSATTVDYWEEIVREYGREQLTTSPTRFLARAVADFADLRRTLERRQPLEFQRRLYRVMGQLAGLIAIEVNDASEHREAYAWLHTAHLAADEADDRHLRAWISVKEATWYLWYDRPVHRAVELARIGQAIAGPKPSAAGVLAALIEARAQARFGRRAEALSALRRADAAFERLPPGETEETMLGVDAHRLHWNKGNALTLLGEVGPAMDAQRHANHLSSVDVALVAMDRSTCLIRGGELDQGCAVARQALLSLRPESRCGLPIYRAQQVARMIAPADGRRGAARDLREVIADWRVLATVPVSDLSNS